MPHQQSPGKTDRTYSLSMARLVSRLSVRVIETLDLDGIGIFAQSWKSKNDSFKQFENCNTFCQYNVNDFALSLFVVSFAKFSWSSLEFKNSFNFFLDIYLCSCNYLEHSHYKSGPKLLFCIGCQLGSILKILLDTITLHIIDLVLEQ